MDFMKKCKAVLAIIMVLSLLVGCGSPAATSSTSSTASDDAPAEDGVIKIGIIAPVTGTNKLVGEYTLNGAELAKEEINASGGILGKQIELVIGDEVDNLQDSVNATTMLLSNNEISAIIGSLYSQYCIAVMPNVLETKIPYFASGSSSGVSKENNPYVWQVRPVDTFQGKALVEFATTTLNMKNPAIMYSTQSTFASLSEQVVAAFKDVGVEITDNNLFGFPEEETNYAPYFAQILSGDYDGIIALANQMPSALICQQAEISGVDPAVLPCVGSTSFCSNVCLSNAKSAANSWYSVADWVPGGANEAGAAFETAYVAKYNAPSDLPSVTFYDAMYLIKAACEASGATDRESINEGLKTIKKYPGAISTFSYFDDHVFATSLGVTQNIDEQANMISAVTFREP